jgi:hypothetical protein
MKKGFGEEDSRKNSGDSTQFFRPDFFPQALLGKPFKLAMDRS